MHGASRRAQRGAVPHRHKLVWPQLRFGRLLHQQLGGLVQGLVGQATGLGGAKSKEREQGGV